MASIHTIAPQSFFSLIKPKPNPTTTGPELGQYGPARRSGGEPSGGRRRCVGERVGESGEWVRSALREALV